MTTFWAEAALLDGEAATASVVIEVADGVIVAVDVADRVPINAETLSGLVIPAMVNAHTHAFHRALRGRTSRGVGDFWAWRELMYRVADRLDPDRYLDLATACFAEMALAGITWVGEFHYVHHQPGGAPYADPNAMGLAVIEAARRAGIRITLLDVCYLHGGFGQSLNEHQRRFSDGSVGRWAERVARLHDAVRTMPGSRVMVGAAPHSVRAVDAWSLRQLSDFASSSEMVVHSHVSEQQAENEMCRSATGRTPVELVSDAGLLGPRFTAVHATHLTDDDIAVLGMSNTNVCCCPTTERDLADGVGPASALHHGGSPICVGSDSNSVIDLFEEARAVELDERMISHQRGHFTTLQLRQIASVNGARSLGGPGQPWGLQPGAPADMVSLSLDGVRLAGLDHFDASAQVMYAAHPADVRHVIVGGNYVVRDGHHQLIDDVPGELQRSMSAVMR